MRLEESGERFLFHVDRCPICWGRRADAPICRAQVGLLQEAMHWVTGGQHVAVDEIECLAQGAPSCTYAVEKRPLA